MTTLVTGATGFVGASVARKLVARGEAVRVLVRPTSDRRNLEGLDVEAVEGDLRDRASLGRAMKGASALYHVAADYRLWTRDPDELYASNVEGSKMIVEAAAEAGVGRTVYTSSVAVLGINKDATPSDEQTPVTIDDMIGHYKRSKFQAEEAVRALISEHDLDIVIVNPSTPIGPRDVKPTPTGRMVLDAARGKLPAFVDTGLNVVHVDDVAEGHLLAYDKGLKGERYILGGHDMSLQAILTEVARLAGRKPPRLKLPHGAVMPVAAIAESWARLFGGEPLATRDGIRMARKKMYFSSAKAQAALGYAPRPAAEALKDAVAWFRDTGYL
ncbi:MAG: NAD-dependent epimerase/dehydratase family protein [Alphaproteobacteria bacterium]|nr:NAD-dependent epimerase/dehydratase family protein [Alphaproteobacteria bacterium]